MQRSVAHEAFRILKILKDAGFKNEEIFELANHPELVRSLKRRFDDRKKTAAVAASDTIVDSQVTITT